MQKYKRCFTLHCLCTSDSRKIKPWVLFYTNYFFELNSLIKLIYFNHFLEISYTIKAEIFAAESIIKSDSNNYRGIHLIFNRLLISILKTKYIAQSHKYHEWKQNKTQYFKTNIIAKNLCVAESRWLLSLNHVMTLHHISCDSSVWMIW